MTRHRSFAPSTGAFVVVPEENEKSEPFSNRKQVRIFLVWWARVDSNHRSWKAADLQSVPIGHSGTRPYSLFMSFAGRLAYFIMKEGFCQLFFTFFFKCIFRAEKRLSKGGKSPAAMRARQSRRKSQPEEIDRKIARKTRDNMWKVQDFFISALKNTVRRDILKT